MREVKSLVSYFFFRETEVNTPAKANVAEIIKNADVKYSIIRISILTLHISNSM